MSEAATYDLAFSGHFDLDNEKEEGALGVSLVKSLASYSAEGNEKFRLTGPFSKVFPVCANTKKTVWYHKLLDPSSFISACSNNTKLGREGCHTWNRN